MPRRAAGMRSWPRIIGRATSITRWRDVRPHQGHRRQALEGNRTGKVQRQRMKALQLGINYGMGVRSLSRGLGRHPMIGSEVIIRHQQRYPTFWAWRAEMVQRAMLRAIDRVRIRRLAAAPLHSPNKRTLYNFPMQSGGAEMLRLAANRLCDAGLVPSMLVHDGILFELDNEEQVQHAIEIMRAAGRRFVAVSRLASMKIRS